MGDKSVRILYCKIVFSNVLETFILVILQDNVGFLKRLRKAQHLNNTELESPCEISSKGSFFKRISTAFVGHCTFIKRL